MKPSGVLCTCSWTTWCGHRPRELQGLIDKIQPANAVVLSPMKHKVMILSFTNSFFGLLFRKSVGQFRRILRVILSTSAYWLVVSRYVS